jgi:8-oxo-dGTP diphosphatase
VREWVVGFMLDEYADFVVLIRKNRPAWQAGKLNGPGGKVEPGETPHDAMVRQFAEETGCEWPDWHHFVSLQWEQGVVHFFRAFAPDGVVASCRTTTDEAVERHYLRDLLTPGNPLWATPNLLWLIPLAAHRHDTYEVINVVETGTTLRKVGRAGDDPDGVHRSSIGAI